MERCKVRCEGRSFARPFECVSLLDSTPAFDIKSRKGLDRSSNLLKVQGGKVALFQSIQPFEEGICHLISPLRKYFRLCSKKFRPQTLSSAEGLMEDTPKSRWIVEALDRHERS